MYPLNSNLSLPSGHLGFFMSQMKQSTCVVNMLDEATDLD